MTNLPLDIEKTAEGTLQINNQIEEYKHYIDIQQKMAYIQQEMRETPPPPSEVVQGQPSNTLLRVEFPPEGGTLTYMSGFELPFQGFPFSELVERMDVVKKMTKGFKSGFHHILWKHFTGWKRPILIFLTTPFFRIYAHAEIATCWRYIERHKIKPRVYCTAMREVHRAMSVPTGDDERMRTTKLREMMRDLLCMHLEFDNAYRFRFQDVIVELDKCNLEKDPLKEMLRLLNIMSDREIHQEVKDTWTLTQTMVEYLKYSKEIRMIIISFLNNINTDKCKLDKRDIPFCVTRNDYRFKSLK
jgi:hypothetical protein